MTQTLPETMRFVDVPQPGAPEAMKVSHRALPVPKEGEVLIRVMAAGVNRPDVQQRKGLYPPPPSASPILGLEVAGEIVAMCPNVTQFRLGDKVAALCNGGAYAEYVAAPALQCLPWPRGFTAIQAAALPETYFTVWANLFDLGQFQPGESLLVHGGTSGIGIAAIQFAVSRGSKVFATVGSAEKCAAVEALGATPINYREQDFAEIVTAATNKHGVDLVLDIVGAPYTIRNLAILARGGRLLQVSLMQGNMVADFDLRPIMLRRLTITGSTMRPRSTEDKGAIAAALLKNIWPQLEAGAYAPVIEKVFPFTEVVAAHALMETSKHIGKIMLAVAD